MEALLQTAITELSQGRGVQYAIGAGITMLLYDVVITTGDEIRLIWAAPRSVAKYLYYFNRYSVPAVLLFHMYVMASYGGFFTDEVCYRYLFWLQVFDCVEGAGIIGILILLRVYALYRNVPGIKGIIVLLWLLYSVPTTVLVICSCATYFAAPEVVTYNSILGLCAITGRPDYLWAIWPFMVAFESIVCGMIAFRAYQDSRSSFHSRIVAILLRDGLLYYAIMLVGEILNMAAFEALGGTLYYFALYPNWCIASLLVSRIYLNLRDVHSHHDWSTATTLRDMPQVDAEVKAANVRNHDCDVIKSSEVDDPSIELAVMGPDS